MTTSIPARTAEMNVAQALKSASDRFRIVRDAADPTFKAASEQDYNSFRGEMLHVENLLGLTTSR
jgi:hypothetical protein